MCDCGWTYLFNYFGWRYFRKAGGSSEEIFTDPASKLQMVQTVFRWRMLPILCLFLCCVIPGYFRLLGAPSVTERVLFVIYCVLFALYAYLVVHCGLGFRRLWKKYGGRR